MLLLLLKSSVPAEAQEARTVIRAFFRSCNYVTVCVSSDNFKYWSAYNYIWEMQKYISVLVVVRF
jgi:hypothetical protein